MGLVAVALIGAVIVAAIITLVRRERRRAQADEWAGTSQAGVSLIMAQRIWTLGRPRKGSLTR